MTFGRRVAALTEQAMTTDHDVENEIAAILTKAGAIASDYDKNACLDSLHTLREAGKITTARYELLTARVNHLAQNWTPEKADEFMQSTRSDVDAGSVSDVEAADIGLVLLQLVAWKLVNISQAVELQSAVMAGISNPQPAQGAATASVDQISATAVVKRRRRGLSS